MVFLGHTVKLLDLDDDSEQLVRLVGEAQPPDANSDVLPVSVNSPMGEALMKAQRRRHGEGEGAARDDGVQDPGDRVDDEG